MMKPIQAGTLSLLAALFVCSASAFAADFNVVTNHLPPLKYVEDKKPTGIMGDVLTELLKKTGHTITLPTRSLPLKQAMKIASQEPDTVCLGLARTPGREPNFRWVGPVYTTKSGIISKKNRGLNLSRLADARKLTLAVVTDSAPDKRLVGAVLDKDRILYFSGTRDAVQALASDQVDGLLMGVSFAYHLIEQGGFKPTEYETAITLDAMDLYLAFSLQTDEEIVTNLQDTLDAMKKTDVMGMSHYLKIISKYYIPQ